MPQTGFTPVVIVTVLIILIGIIASQLEIAIGATPSLYNTFTPLTKPAPSPICDYDLLGKVVKKAEAASLLETEAGRRQLSPQNGAVEVTEDLINKGRKAFYSETFKDQIFQTDVVGALKGLINLVTLTKAIARLAGKPTTNLLARSPGNFDSTDNLVNNPAQIPSSYTPEALPYGWSGFSSVSWFHGLTTLNNNVHATNSDATTGADSSLPLLGIDKETYLGVIFQNAANQPSVYPKALSLPNFLRKLTQHLDNQA